MGQKQINKVYVFVVKPPVLTEQLTIETTTVHVPTYGRQTFQTNLPVGIWFDIEGMIPFASWHDYSPTFTHMSCWLLSITIIYVTSDWLAIPNTYLHVLSGGNPNLYLPTS